MIRGTTVTTADGTTVTTDQGTMCTLVATAQGTTAEGMKFPLKETIVL